MTVENDPLWGQQTSLAMSNFAVSGMPMHRDVINMIANIKGEAAVVNHELGAHAMSADMADAIRSAAQEIVAGGYADQFPVDVFQTGSGTSTNMNVNEVISTLASATLGRSVHPNDHVNASQSSNDVVPTAVRAVAAMLIHSDLLVACDRLIASLDGHVVAWSTVVKVGRTHLMDALPVTLGQEFAGYSAQIEAARERLAICEHDLCALPLGATAVGTGVGAPHDFGERVIARLAAATGLPFCCASNRLSKIAAHDDLVACSAALRTLAIALLKIANDVRWMASGPRAGVAEIHLPALQAGSSIMPGKVNPVMSEVVVQIAAQVIGNDACVAFCATQGAFELNTTIPVLARNLIESIELLTNGIVLFADRCIDGINPDIERCRMLAEASPAIATGLSPWLGYDEVAAIVEVATNERRSIAEVAKERTSLDPSTIDRVLDVVTLAAGPHPHL